MRVAVIGSGLVGGSVGLALRAVGIEVVAHDVDPARAARAVELGAASSTAPTVAAAAAGADLVVVAVPVAHIAAIAVEALDAGALVVTDVGSVKGPVVAAVEAARPVAAARFVGGHPMAGSEQDGVAGADADLFDGCVWLLTPTRHTDPDVLLSLRSLVTQLGAEVVALTPEDHDELVAVVSHVPQLAATTLMDVAAAGAQERATLLRLAAGGFRDMTRIAAGNPTIWPDICVANREAIVAALDNYLAALGDVRALVAAGDRGGILALLERGRRARRSLPVGATVGGVLVELRVPVLDRPGVLAEVTTLAGILGVNIADVEIAHSMEGGRGVLVLVVPESGAAALEEGLTDAGYHPSRTPLT